MNPPHTPPWNRRDFIKTGLLSAAALSINPKATLSGTPKNLPDPSSTRHPLKIEEDWIVVTEAPYFADPTGETDSTEALQAALDESRNRTTVCFFPSGTYLISDTLSCEQRVRKMEKPRYTDGMRQSWWDIRSDRYYILGSTIGPRPTIKLAPNAKGYSDPQNPKLAMRIWAQTRNDVPGTHDPEWGAEQPNILFGQYFRGVDFDISGHPGAIALRFAGSQGCSLMDCSVQATGAFAGFNNCPGQGGGTYNLEVTGGKHAIWADSYYRFPMLASCKFVEQEESCIVYSDAHLPLVLVGGEFHSKGNCLFDLTRIQSFPGITVVDSVLKLENGKDLTLSREPINLLLENTWLLGMQRFANSSDIVLAPDSWTHVQLFANCNAESQSLINGAITNETIFKKGNSPTPPSAQSLRDRHWLKLPSFEDKNTVNIRDFGANGDGESNDTPALLAAFEKSNSIYFPKGNYKFDSKITLPANCKLFGYKEVVIDAPELRTSEGVQDHTTVAFLNLTSPISWGSGKGDWAFTRGNLTTTRTGGGRFFAKRFHRNQHKGYLFANTEQPITLYTLNIERQQTNPQATIKNVKNLKIFYLKAEANPRGYNVHGGPNTGNTPLAIIDSDNVQLYSACGLVITENQRPFVQVTNTKNVRVSHVKSFRTGDFSQITETTDLGRNSIPSDHVAALMIRD